MSKVTSDTSGSACASRRLAAAAAFAAVLAAALPARAADVVEACAAASEEAQARRDRGELREARKLLLTCAAEACPAVVRKDCAAWLEDVEARQPSIVLRVRDAAGQDRADVRVSIDGVEAVSSLDGRALAVDPGSRKLRFEAEGAPAVEQTVLVREREQGRVIDVVLAPAKPEAPASGGAREGEGGVGDEGGGLRIPVGAWALGGAAIAGGVVFGVFGARAKGEVDEMRGSCAPDCDPARVDAAKREALVANVALGVGAAAFTGAVVVVLLGQGDEKAPAARARVRGREHGRGRERGRGPTMTVGFGGAAGPGVVVRGRF